MLSASDPDGRLLGLDADGAAIARVRTRLEPRFGARLRLRQANFRELGTGRYDANRETAMTNFVAALAQSEAAMEIFREQNAGHFVMISSMSAMRGMPKTMTTYAATKAGVAHIAEGLRYELYGKPIKVTVLYPGYISSEMNERVDPKKAKGMVSTEKGVRSMVAAIEKEVDSACVPPLPWAPMSLVMKHAPLGVLKRIM